MLNITLSIIQRHIMSKVNEKKEGYIHPVLDPIVLGYSALFF